MELLFADITNKILQAFYGFKNKLPIELDLSFFKNALEVELLEIGLEVQKDKSVEIIYKQKIIGSQQIDFIVNDKIAIKVVAENLDIDNKHIVEMKNFLRLTKYEVALILNFGADGEHTRVFLTNDYKNSETQ